MLTGDMLRRSAERFPAKDAILFEGRALSYAEFDRKANQFANALLASGVSTGTKVGIISTNRPEYAISFFGSARSGAVLVNISVLYSSEELAFVLEKADVEMLFIEQQFVENLNPVLEKLPKVQSVFVIGIDTNSPVSFENFLSRQTDTPPDVELSPDDPFCMTYTGGTTGRPKGVLVSHRNRAVTAHTVVVEEGLDERDVVGIVTPMFHVAALNIMFQPAILVGASVALLSKWSVAGFSEMVQTTQMTAAFMVPTQAGMLISDKSFKDKNFLSWKKLSFAGAPMPDWVQSAFLKKLPQIKLTQIYGQSEVGVITSLRYWNLPEKLGSIGRQCFNVDIAIVNEDGTPVKHGEIGEVVSRGDNVMLQYYNEPEQTEKFFKHGWGWTGDLATIDADGFVTLVDRSKDMIISGGENIYPKEIEDAIYQLPDVAECAVFGIPDKKWGEVPAAFLLLHHGQELSEHEVVAYCEKALARFKRPRLIEFVTAFPKTPIGKIQKNILREPFWKTQEKKI